MISHRSKRLGCLALAMLLGIGAGCQEQAEVFAKSGTLRCNVTKKTVQAGKNFQLKVTGKKKYLKKLKWNSSDKSVAAVSVVGNGRAKVKGKKAGKARITIKVKGTSLKVSCQVTVKKKTSSAASSAPEGSASKTPSSAAPSSAAPGGSAVPSAPAGAATGSPEGSASAAGPGSQAGTAAPVMATGIPGPDVTATVPVTSPVPVVSPTKTPAAVDDSVFLVSKQLVTVDGELMTAYIVNKKFYGQITIRFGDREYSTTDSARNIVVSLAISATTKENHDGTVRVTRKSTSDYWEVQDLTGEKTYYLKAAKDNTVDPSVADCGVIYVLGDVMSEFEVTGVSS